MVDPSLQTRVLRQKGRDVSKDTWLVGRRAGTKPNLLRGAPNVFQETQRSPRAKAEQKLRSLGSTPKRPNPAGGTSSSARVAHLT